MNIITIIICLGNFFLSKSGFYDSSAVREMLKESSKMYKFDHPNVLTLTGVCVDGGPAPFIIMPFMANGSLLAYLKKNRMSLIVSFGDSNEAEEVNFFFFFNVILMARVYKKGGILSPFLMLLLTVTVT